MKNHLPWKVESFLESEYTSFKCFQTLATNYHEGVNERVSELAVISESNVGCVIAVAYVKGARISHRTTLP